jgi:CRISPR-associated protein Cmr1
MNKYTVKIKALTPIWTGDADRKNTTLRETGIIGSLRWWYEALIRGLGGTACDPTNTNCNRDNHCDACELFGCTGWARKFRLEVEKKNDNETIDLRFIEMREMKNIEWALLNKTIKIISDYGAIGGKIAEAEYGIIKIEQNGLDKFDLKKEELNNYLRKKVKGVDNPNLSRFIFIKNQNNKTFIEIKNNLSFLKGAKNKGKKYFYKTINKKPNRLFVYAEKDDEFNCIKKFLNKKPILFIEGLKLLEELK